VSNWLGMIKGAPNNKHTKCLGSTPLPTGKTDGWKFRFMVGEHMSGFDHSPS
jgi:hypothetical protein